MGSVQFQIIPCFRLYFFPRSIGPFQCLVSANYKVLTCCTCRFQSCSLFFVYFGFLCLQAPHCLISTLTWGGKGGHLLRLTCSVVLWGGRGTASKCHSCVGSACSVWATLGLLQLMAACGFQVYTARAPGCSEGELSKAHPALHALPRSKPLRFRLSSTPQRHRLSWACVLCPSQVWAAKATRCMVSALSQVWWCILSLPSSWPILGVPQSTVSDVLCVSSGELISGCDAPGRCQLSRIPGRRG